MPRRLFVLLVFGLSAVSFYYSELNLLLLFEINSFVIVFGILAPIVFILWQRESLTGLNRPWLLEFLLAYWVARWASLVWPTICRWPMQPIRQRDHVTHGFIWRDRLRPWIFRGP